MLAIAPGSLLGIFGGDSRNVVGRSVLPYRADCYHPNNRKTREVPQICPTLPIAVDQFSLIYGLAMSG
jgi:hypothetical protein